MEVEGPGKVREKQARVSVLICAALPFGLPRWQRAQRPMQETPETQVQSLGWEDALQKEMATHPSVLAWETPRDRGAWRATVHGVAKSRTRLSARTHTFPCTRASEAARSGREALQRGWGCGRRGGCPRSFCRASPPVTASESRGHGLVIRPHP